MYVECGRAKICPIRHLFTCRKYEAVFLHDFTARHGDGGWIEPYGFSYGAVNAWH